MADSNQIAYTFIAIDKFSAVAQKIQRILKDFSKNTDQLSGKIKESNEKMVVSTTNLREIVDAFNKTSMASQRAGSKVDKFTENVKNSNKHLAKSKSALDSWADRFGMQAYFKYMNIALPMTLITRSGMEYSQSMGEALTSMNALFGRMKGFTKLQHSILVSAQKYQDVGPFGEAQYVSTTSKLAQRFGNLKYAEKFMPLVMKYAAATGQQHENLTSIASKLLSAVLQGKAGVFPVSTANRKLLTQAMSIEGPAQARIERFMKILPHIIKDDVFTRQSQSSYVQFQRFHHAISRINGELITTLLPTFRSLGDRAVKYEGTILQLIDKHKALVNLVGKFSMVISASLVGLIGVGVAAGALSLAFKGLAIAMLPFKALSAIAGSSALGSTLVGGVGIGAAAGVGVVGAVKGWEGLKNVKWSHLGQDFKTVGAHPLDFLKYYALSGGGVEVNHNITLENKTNTTLTHGVRVPKSHIPYHLNVGRNEGSFNHE